MIRNKYKTMNIPVKTVIPNMITCGSIFCGTASLIMTLHANFIPAAILIFFAVFFDIMDGRVARSLGGSSAFGEELDSLADAISFGLAPALLMYSVYIDAAGGILGILAAAFFALCGVLRLARFNVSHVPAGPFQGLPIPAGGLTLAAFVIARFPLAAAAAMLVMAFIGALMVSSVPFCNAKKLKRGNFNKARFYAVWALIFACFMIFRSKGFLAVAFIYIGTGLARFDMAEWVLDEEKADEK
jgi:CDP-diacylglycerol--serine O-phosphatidyltransferase